MSRKFPLALAAALALAGSAHAADFSVSAHDNSTSGGTGLGTITLAAGEAFTVTVAADDLWSAGSLPRWSDADGLTYNRYATGSDESGQAAGTLIGIDFGLWNQYGHSFAYGTLVGRVGNGDYFAVGTNYSGTADASGTLQLFYWDSNNADNTGSVLAHVSSVPEPASMALMLAGLGAMGLAARRRRG